MSDWSSDVCSSDLQLLVRVGAAHPEAEPAVSGEQVADRLEDIDTRRRLGFAIGLCLFDQRTDLGCDRFEAAADQRCEAILIKAATLGDIGIDGLDDAAPALDEGLLEPGLLLGGHGAEGGAPESSEEHPSELQA